MSDGDGFGVRTLLRIPSSRRSFFANAAFSAAVLAGRPFVIRASTSPALMSASCRLEARSRFSPPLEKFIAKLPAGSDQFTREKYAAAIGALLGKLSAALESSPQDTDLLGNLVAADVMFCSLADLKAVPLRREGPIRSETIEFEMRKVRGREAFLDSWRAYLSPFTKITCAEFQVIGVQTHGESPLAVETELRYDFVGHCAGEICEERSGVWEIEWERDSAEKWRVRTWRPLKETRTTVAGAGFVEITSDCLGGNSSYEKQMLRGLDYWRTVYDAASGIDVYGNNGVAVGDFDGDGFDDLYICQPSGLPNRLYRNRGDGTFEDVTEGSGVGLLDGTASALFADFTNSGSQDLLVVRTTGPLLFRNLGRGKFELRPDAFRFSKPPAGSFTSVAAADYNRDGLLDVYFCLYAYYQGLSQYTHPKPYYDAQNGPPNFLMRNRGDGTFEDVTESSGMNRNNNRFTFACGWCDYDNDGWPDLYVANDFGRKNFYRSNRDGTFTDIAHEAGIEDYGAGMSVSWFDYDNDGRQDLYVADMWSDAGKRVTTEETFLPGIDANIRKAYQKHANGNSLFRNHETGVLSDATEKAQVAMGRWAWGADAWDFDHDGYNDLYVTNGFISGATKQDLSSFFWRQVVARSLDTGSGSADYEAAWSAINELIRSDYSWNGYERNVFFLNNRDGSFSEVSGALGMDFRDDSRAFALSDLDHDGRLEVILKNRNAPQIRILRNDLAPIGNSVIFRLQGSKSNRDAIGAVVTVEAGPLRQVKSVQAGSGFLAQHTKELHFGLGSASGPIRASVWWPNGLMQSFEDIPLNHRIAIREGAQEFQAISFSSPKSHGNRPEQPLVPESLPSRFETWLIEPLRAPDFTLRDSSGQMQSLKEWQGKPLVLSIAGGDCNRSREQLAKFQRASNTFHRESIGVVALAAGSLSEQAKAFFEAAGVQFPVLFADEMTVAVYNILYRYLFDRRRDLELPVSFLIDAHGSIIKVYQGDVDPMHIVSDCTNAPQTAESRLHRALAFPGPYHGALPRRNYFTYGIAYIQSEQIEAAMACFQAAIEANPGYAAAYYNLGTIYLNKQMLKEARTNLERAVALDPEDADAWTNLGSIAGQEKNYDEALEYLQQAVRVKPGHLVALQNLVMLYRWQGRLDQAQQALEKAVAVEPNDPEFHFALGMLLAGQQKLEGARRELERTLELRANDMIALNNLGVVYLQLGREAQALESFQRCTTNAPDYDRPYLNIALMYKQKGQDSKARDTLRDFLKRHPDNEEIKKTLNELGQ